MWALIEKSDFIDDISNIERLQNEIQHRLLNEKNIGKKNDKIGKKIEREVTRRATEKPIKISEIYWWYIEYINKYYIGEYIRYIGEYVRYIVDISGKYRKKNWKLFFLILTFLFLNYSFLICFFILNLYYHFIFNYFLYLSHLYMTYSYLESILSKLHVLVWILCLQQDGLPSSNNMMESHWSSFWY